MGPRLRKAIFSDLQPCIELTLYPSDKGEHDIHINHKALGQTCGLLPVGVTSTILTVRGLEWNLSAFIRLATLALLKCRPAADTPSGFDGLISMSNHLLPEEPIVYVKTTEPIFWTAELRPEAFAELPSV